MSFSIITPSYNQLDWLRLCIASVHDQVESQRSEVGDLRSEVGGQESEVRGQEPGVSFSVEHIVQDGGSEGIEDFAREVGANFYRDGQLVFAARNQEPGTTNHEVLTSKQEPLTKNYVLSIHTEPDSGMYDAVNRGLVRSKGGLCAYLNCDEQYLPGALAEAARWFASHPHKDVLFADALLLNSDGNALSYRRTVLPDRLHTRLCHLNTLTCSTFFRKNIIERGYQFPSDKKIIGDGVWADAMLTDRIPMGYLKRPTSTFTFTGANMSEIDKGVGGEQDAWLDEPGSPPRWLRRPVSLMHRFKKMLNGAYQKRTFTYAIYSAESPYRRTEYHAQDLGSGWPGRTP